MDGVKFATLLSFMLCFFDSYLKMYLLFVKFNSYIKEAISLVLWLYKLMSPLKIFNIWCKDKNVFKIYFEIYILYVH